MREAREITQKCKIDAVRNIVLSCLPEAETYVYNNTIFYQLINLDQVLDVFE